MKTMMLAAVAALSLASTAAFANEGGPEANTLFTEIPGVIAQAPVQNPASAVAQSGQVQIYATQSEQAASPFQAGYNNG